MWFLHSALLFMFRFWPLSRGKSDRGMSKFFILLSSLFLLAFGELDDVFCPLSSLLLVMICGTLRVDHRKATMIVKTVALWM